jgi:hypothetical protein
VSFSGCTHTFWPESRRTLHTRTCNAKAHTSPTLTSCNASWIPTPQRPPDLSGVCFGNIMFCQPAQHVSYFMLKSGTDKSDHASLCTSSLHMWMHTHTHSTVLPPWRSTDNTSKMGKLALPGSPTRGADGASRRCSDSLFPHPWAEESFTTQQTELNR